MTSEDPFAVLGLAPTVDSLAVKSAYFAALGRHPPHRDPEGFQRLRRAYEALTRPGALAAAYLASPVDVQKLAEEARERFDRALEEALTAGVDSRRREESVARWVERCSRMSWDEALRVFAE
jgi:curved DNA-binding protein CbpA